MQMPAKKWFMPLVLLIATQVPAQLPKYIIELYNKAGTAFTVATPLQYLSARAVARRQRQQIAMDSLDLPVSKIYMDSIAKIENITIVSTSRWLNQLLVQTSSISALNKVRDLGFVKNISGAGFRLVSQQQPITKFAVETISTINETSNGTGINGNEINYGLNYNQVHLHEGEFLHNKGFRGEGMQIAVLDGGFAKYKLNTAFDSARINRQFLGDRDFVAFDNSVNEDDSHGANCLSIMAANLPGRVVGTAPHANYWLLRTENTASEYLIEEHNWVVGAEFADSSGADIISSSLGYTDFDNPTFNHNYLQFYKNQTMVTQGAGVAAKKGMIVMNSAGNEGSSQWRYIGFPADGDSVCAVGAVNANGQIASFSSYGYPGKVKPNIVSVGLGTILVNTNSQPASGNGTSYSNPNIAGLIACLWQAFPTAGNMKLLNAVYKSADRYATPDNRFGYGIPNMKTAYRILKKQQNDAAFGSNWLVAGPAPFTTLIDGFFVAQVDGAARVDLLNTSGKVLYTLPFFTEQQEVYTFLFTNLNVLPGGNYAVRYMDSVNSKTVLLQKNFSATGNWLRLNPGNVFTGTLQVGFTAPETGTVAFRLLNVKGSKLIEQQLSITEGQNQTITLPVQLLQPGAYFLQYISKTQKQTIRVMKLP